MNGLHNSNREYMPDGPFCAAIGALSWYGAWAAWLWTGAYACLARKYFVDGKHQYSLHTNYRSLYLLLHTICWIVPALLLGSVPLSGGRFGREMESDFTQCSIVTPQRSWPWSEAPVWLMWIVGAYCIGIFISIHRMLSRHKSLASPLLTPEERSELDRKTRVWPFFVGYTLSFFCSQVRVRVS